jgi:hypothetical protein
MLKEEEQTHGQKLLKQLRETYKKPETLEAETDEDANRDDASESWAATISNLIN